MKNNLPKIVGFVGFAGCGKNTASNYLFREFDYRQIAFAGAVKDAVAAIFQWDRKLLEGDLIESRKFRDSPDPWWSEKFQRDFTPREAMQLMGTEVGRNIFHPDIWVHSVFKTILSGPMKYVITDVRFPNEIKAIKENNGIVIRIKKGSEPDWFFKAATLNRSGKTDGLPIHYSEWAWIGSPIDYTITNDGTVDDLFLKLENLFKNIA